MNSDETLKRLDLNCRNNDVIKLEAWQFLPSRYDQSAQGITARNRSDHFNTYNDYYVDGHVQARLRFLSSGPNSFPSSRLLQAAPTLSILLEPYKY